MTNSNINNENRGSKFLRWGMTLLSSALFLFLLSRQNWEAAANGLAKIGWVMIGAALFLYGCSYLFNTARWYVYLYYQKVKISFWQTLRLTFVGNFSSNFLPSTVGGDTIRVISLMGYTDQKIIAFGSVILDRLTNMAAMACLLPVSYTIINFLKLPLSAGLINSRRIGELFERSASQIKAAIAAWASHPWSFLLAFILAWPSNLLPMLATYLFARKLEMDVTYLQVIGVQTLTYFVSILPISINGYGVREMAYTALYMSLGPTMEQSLLLALITRVIMLIMSLPGALWLPHTLSKLFPNNQ